jgi:hypothetical protein
MALRVDFSTPGTYTASFEYDQPIHNCFLGLDVPDRILSDMSPDVLLSGLQGTYAIIDEDGKQIIRGPLVGDPNEIRLRYFQNIIELRELFDWYGKVKWKVNATVAQGAPCLKGIPQRLVLIDRTNALRFVDDVLFFVTCASSLLAAIILTIVIGISVRKRKQPENSKT